MLSGSVDGYACLSNWTTGVTHGRTELHTNSVESVLFYNHLFLTGCVDGFVRWYDTNTLKKVNNYQFKVFPSYYLGCNHQNAQASGFSSCRNFNFRGRVVLHGSSLPQREETVQCRQHNPRSDLLQADSAGCLRGWND